MKVYVASVLVLAAVPCLALAGQKPPVVAPPPPILPGIPGQHWRLCLSLVEAALQEVVLGEPAMASATTPVELSCIRMRAAAECGYLFQKLAADNNNSLVLPGRWCAEDFAVSAKQAVANRCGDDPGEYVAFAVEEITSSMALRIAASLASRGKN